MIKPIQNELLDNEYRMNKFVKVTLPIMRPQLVAAATAAAASIVPTNTAPLPVPDPNPTSLAVALLAALVMIVPEVPTVVSAAATNTNTNTELILAPEAAATAAAAAVSTVITIKQQPAKIKKQKLEPKTVAAVISSKISKPSTIDARVLVVAAAAVAAASSTNVTRTKRKRAPIKHVVAEPSCRQLNCERPPSFGCKRNDKTKRKTSNQEHGRDEFRSLSSNRSCRRHRRDKTIFVDDACQ